MKKKNCAFESRVLKELARGHPGPEVKNHLKECPVCRDLATVGSWMGNFQKAMEKEAKELGKRVPDFDLLWNRAGSYGSHQPELERKAMMPLIIPRIFSFLLAGGGIFFLLTTQASQIKEFFFTDLRVGALFNLFWSLGKKMFVLMPYVMIPLVCILFFMLVYFLFSLFNPRKV